MNDTKITLPKEFDNFLFNRWIQKSKPFIERFLKEKVKLYHYNCTDLLGRSKDSIITEVTINDPNIKFKLKKHVPNDMIQRCFEQNNSRTLSFTDNMWDIF